MGVSRGLKGLWGFLGLSAKDMSFVSKVPYGLFLFCLKPVVVQVLGDIRRTQRLEAQRSP